jgi:catechol 2,3-dioxygenase-like lactoylglutathione lyase family enzyme
MSLRFAHAMIQVRDLEKAVRFYAEVLGFAVAARHDYEGASLVYLRCPRSGCEVELLSEKPWRFTERPETGRNHIAFASSELEAERSRIAALGVPCGDITPYEANGRLQTRFFYIYDPEGNEIEILESVGRYSEEGNSHDSPHDAP